jgi:hypothetical protein
MPRSIVVNTTFGGFSLSREAKDMYQALFRQKTPGDGLPDDLDDLDEEKLARDDPILVAVVTQLGSEASSGHFAKLGIVHIPDDVPGDGWLINEYDGAEWVAEKHRTWHASSPEPDLPPTQPDPSMSCDP